MKNNLDFFTHYTAASRNRKFKALRARYGYEGQGRFWHLNEIIAESDNCRLDLTDDLAVDSLADDLGMRTPELQNFLTFLEERCKLIQRDESGSITTDQVQEDLARVMQTREAAQKRRAKRSTGGAPEQPINGRGSPTNGNSLATVTERMEKVTEQNAQRSVEQSRLEQRSGEEGARTLDAGSVRRILGTVVDLRDGEDVEFASSLNASGLDAGFLTWFVGRVRATREERAIRSVKGFVVAFCRSPQSYSTWIDEYRESKKPARPGISLKCPKCGGRLNRADDRGRCVDCRSNFKLHDGAWILVEFATVAG